MGFHAKRGDRKKIKVFACMDAGKWREQDVVAFICVHSRSFAEKINRVTK